MTDETACLDVGCPIIGDKENPYKIIVSPIVMTISTFEIDESITTSGRVLKTKESTISRAVVTHP